MHGPTSGLSPAGPFTGSAIQASRSGCRALCQAVSWTPHRPLDAFARGQTGSRHGVGAR